MNSTKLVSNPLINKCILVIIIILVSLMNNQADASRFDFRHITVDDGLPSNCVRDIEQDNTGFMWFVTDGGVVRYDGQDFVNHSLKGDDKSANNDFPLSIHCVKGKMWVGSDSHLYSYNRKKGAFEVFDKLVGANNRAIRTSVYSLTSDKDDNLWFAVSKEGLFKLNTETGEIENYTIAEFSNWIGQVYVDSRNDVWAVSTQGQGNVYKLNKAENRFERFSLKGLAKGLDTSSMAIYEDSNHKMWLGTWTDGLLCFDPYSGNVIHSILKGELIHVHRLMQYTENELLIGSDSGLMMVNTSTLESTPFVNDELNEFSISDRFVYPIYKDREGGVWIGTYYAGINYLAPELKTFTRWRYSRFSNSVGGKIVSGFCEDSKGDIWIALDDGGLNRFSPKTGTFEHVNVGEISKMNIHALCMDGDDLWIGTYANGVFVLNTVTRKLRHYQSEGMNGSLDSNSTYSIFRDRKGNIWVATMEGVNLYNRDTDDFTNVKTFDALTIDIDEDARGRLWFSTQGHGLMAYNPETGIWKNYREDMGGLPHNHVNGVTIDNSGTMWVATANGLCHYVPEKDCFERDAIEVTSQDLLSIVEDQHKLWITTVNGLVRFEPGKGCIIYTTDDGLLSNQFVPNAILKATDGRIYVGSVAGFNAFYPYQIKLNQYQAPVVFTGLDIINKPVSVGDKHLPVPINELDELVLSYEDKVFTIHFAALSYCNPDKNQYSYKLEGFDKDWNFVGDMRQVTYTNLPVGKYKLMVRATNNDGQWSEYTAVLTIKVTPPWWWSLPMKIFYIILVISVLIILIQYLLYRSERHHVAEIKRIEQAKEREVYQAKLSFFTMIAHEIRTPVSLIIGPLEKIMRSYDKLPADVREDLNIINRNNDRLLFLVNQLLDFKKVEQNGLIMRFKHNNLAELMNAVVVRFEPTVEHMGGTLEVHNFASDFVADVDAEAFTKLISNLLNNARKFMTDKIVVDCRVNESAKHFAISVTDNGIGISKENQERIFEPFFQVNDANRASKGGTGIGLSIVKNVVEGHGGTIKVESSEGHGATFTIDFPIHQKNVVASDDDTVDVAETDDKASVDSVTQSGRPVMLVADDNVEMLEFIASSFRGDYEVLTAEDGEEALQLLAENEVSLIVSDWMMPRKNGIEFCKAVRHNAKYSHIPFILLTAKTDNMSKTEGINCGADVYVEKPFSVQYLEACIRNILEMRKLLRQKYSSMPLEPINVIAQTKVDDDFLTKLNEIIEENFSNPDLSVDLLAERLNISRSGLYAKIKALASVSPNELILITRLKKAAQLMKDGQYRVKEICFMVGFNSPSYFAKCFQKQFGMKPTDFVDQC